MFKALYARTIWIMGISFSLIVLSVGLFRYWLPGNEDARMRVENYNAHVAEIKKRDQAIKKKEKAVADVMLAEKQWAPFAVAHTPLQDTTNTGININVNAYQLLLDTKRYRNSVQRALNKQILSGGVKVLSCPRIPGVSDDEAPNTILASYYNYPAVPFPVVIYDLGQVQVQGTYEQIVANVRAWKSMPRYLAVTHNLAITGTAPVLTATYDLSMVGFIRYDGIFAPVPDAGGASGGAAGGAGRTGGGAMGPAPSSMGSAGGGRGPGTTGPPIGSQGIPPSAMTTGGGK